MLGDFMKKIVMVFLLILCINIIGNVPHVLAYSCDNSYAIPDRNFVTEHFNPKDLVEVGLKWSTQGLWGYEITDMEGHHYFMKGPLESQFLRNTHGEIKNSKGKVIGYRYYDLGYYHIYRYNDGRWQVESIYGDTDVSHYGIEPGDTGNFTFATRPGVINSAISYVESNYGVTIKSENVKLYGYEHYKQDYELSSQNFLNLYGLKTDIEGTIDWESKIGYLRFNQFTSYGGNDCGMNSKSLFYNGSDPVRSHAYYVPFMIEIMFDECDYNDEDDFPSCCMYYEENYIEILKAKGLLDFNLDRETALDILYSDHKSCAACRFEDLPIYSESTMPTLSKCCQELYLQYGDDPTYLKYCGEKEAKCPPSVYKVDVDAPIDCTESNTGILKDINDWECIFDSTNQAANFPYSKFYAVETTIDNPYCTVYCREDISYEFPSNNITVDAGRHFTVNHGVSNIPNWQPINFTSNRECRTYSNTSVDNLENDYVEGQIDVEKFLRDWHEANDRMFNEWRSWHEDMTKCENTQGPEPAGGMECCSNKFDENGNCIGSQAPIFKYYVEGATYDHYHESSLSPGFGNWSYQDELTGTHFTSECNWEDPPWCDYADAIYEFEQALKRRTKAEQDIAACNNWKLFETYGTGSSLKGSNYAYSGSYDEFEEYDKFSPDLHLDYNNEQWVYHYNGSLVQNITTGVTTIDTEYSDFSYAKEWNTYSDSKDETLYYKYQGGGNNKDLGPHQYTYPINQALVGKSRKSFTYTLPRELYQYIKKPEGKSVHTRPSGNYVDLGYENLPVHFMTPTGTYPITLTYSSFTNVIDLNHKFDSILFGTKGQKTHAYACSYDVDNEIIECVDPPCNDSTLEEEDKSCIDQCDGDLECIEWCNSCELKDCAMDFDCIQVKCDNPPVDPEDPRSCEEKCEWDETCIKDHCQDPDSSNKTPIDPDNFEEYVSCVVACDGDYACILGCFQCEGKQCGDQDNDDWRGLAVIYRPISLENPFPGMNGETRRPGDNWLKEDCVKVDGKYVCTHITNNRNVQESQIYSSKKPMYEFTLTPAVIQQIREYNKKHEYADFNMDCSSLDGTGKWQQCTSNFLRNKLGSSETTNWSVQIGNQRKSWINWDTCGMQGSWSDCMLPDNLFSS